MSQQKDIDSLTAERKELFQKMAANRKAQAEAKKTGQNDKVQELDSEWKSQRSEAVRLDNEIKALRHAAGGGGGGDAGAGVSRTRNPNQQQENQDQKKSTSQDSIEEINSRQRKIQQDEINRRNADKSQQKTNAQIIQQQKNRGR